MLTCCRPVACSCGAGGDLGDHAVDLGHLATMLLQRLAGLGDQLDALLDLRGRGRDQGLDLLGRFGRALRQRAHFGGDDGEAAAGIAGARRLDAGVERQQVGLEGDLVDHADDLADLLRGLLDLAHRRDGLAHDLAALLGVALGARRRRRGPASRLSAVFLTVAVISSSAAAVSSRLAACCSVRRDRSSDAWVISPAPT